MFNLRKNYAKMKKKEKYPHIYEVDKLQVNKLKNRIKLKKKKSNKKETFIVFFILCLISFFIIVYKIFGFKVKIYNKLFGIINDKKNNMIIEEDIIGNIDNSKKIKLFFPLKVLGLNKIRIGKNGDGGYIFLDDFENIRIAYSFGIGKEISFEKNLADKNIDVFMYDHTIKTLPFQNSKFHWKKLGLKGNYSNDNIFKTLPELIKENGHSNEQNMILKIDIENYEWEVFQNIPINYLNQFKYIVGEFHFLNSEKILKHFNVLKKLLFTHQIFHLHCNNCGNIIKFEEIELCDLLEISFVLKKQYKFENDNNIYPIEGLDYKNCYNKKETSYIINYLKDFNK